MSLKIIILALALMAVRSQEDEGLTGPDGLDDLDEGLNDNNDDVECDEETEVLDCADDDFDCCPISWIGDGYADCGDQVWGCDLSCYEDNDGGDCDVYDDWLVSDAAYYCAEAGWIPDCSYDGDCCPLNWVGDGICDGEDQDYGCDLTCYENTEGDDNDGGDCDGPPEPDANGECTVDGWIADCDGVDCCPEDWIGDGVCDGVDQEYGCDLTCYTDIDLSTGDVISGLADGGDCDDLMVQQNADGECTDDNLVKDCVDTDCCPVEFIGDGYCDGVDQEYGCDLTCYTDIDESTGAIITGLADGGDCDDLMVQQNADGECTDENLVKDCVDTDCCPVGFIGDGVGDCVDQLYGCDLTCYGNDGDDCDEVVTDDEGEGETGNNTGDEGEGETGTGSGSGVVTTGNEVGVVSTDLGSDGTTGGGDEPTGGDDEPTGGDDETTGGVDTTGGAVGGTVVVVETPPLASASASVDNGEGTGQEGEGTE